MSKLAEWKPDSELEYQLAKKKPIVVQVRNVQPVTCNHENPQPFVFGEYITTIEGNTIWVDQTNYIIKGTHGEIYPCKKDIFHETYELLYKSSTKENNSTKEIPENVRKMTVGRVPAKVLADAKAKRMGEKQP